MNNRKSPNYIFRNPKDRVIKVSPTPVVVLCKTEYHGSDMGFSNDACSILKIVDRKDRRLKPVFRRGWTTITPYPPCCHPKS